MAYGEVTFNDGVNPSVTVKGAYYPKQPGISYPMPIAYTMGGGLKTFDPGDGTDWNQPVVHFRNMSNTHYSNLETFFKTTVNWSETSFTYTDPNGTVHTNMHYVGGLESFRSSRGDRWAGTIRLHKDITV
jgi:hypothetical protein